MTLYTPPKTIDSWIITSIEDLIHIDHFKDAGIEQLITGTDHSKSLEAQVDEILKTLPGTYFIDVDWSPGRELVTLTISLLEVPSCNQEQSNIPAEKISINDIWKNFTREEREEIMHYIGNHIRVEEISEKVYDAEIDNYPVAVTGEEFPLIDSGEFYETNSRKIAAFQCTDCDYNGKTDNGTFAEILIHLLREHATEIIPEFEEKYSPLSKSLAETNPQASANTEPRNSTFKYLDVSTGHLPLSDRKLFPIDIVTLLTSLTPIDIPDTSEERAQFAYSNNLKGLTIYPYEHGWWIHVQPDDEQWEKVNGTTWDQRKQWILDCSLSPALIKIMEKARKLGCTFIRLDCDGIEHDDLEYFEEEP
jgi:hypothetical protein